jgi:TPR repeat protein
LFLFFLMPRKQTIKCYECVLYIYFFFFCWNVWKRTLVRTWIQLTLFLPCIFLEQKRSSPHYFVRSFRIMTDIQRSDDQDTRTALVSSLAQFVNRVRESRKQHQQAAREWDWLKKASIVSSSVLAAGVGVFSAALWSDRHASAPAGVLRRTIRSPIARLLACTSAALVLVIPAVMRVTGVSATRDLHRASAASYKQLDRQAASLSQLVSSLSDEELQARIQELIRADQPAPVPRSRWSQWWTRDRLDFDSQAETPMICTPPPGAGMQPDASADDRELVLRYQLAAARGDPVAQYNLGMCYRKGTGVAQDKREAVKWLLLAAQQGYAEAQFYLGVCYTHGTGVVPDQRVAAQWARRAADQGLAAAQFSLGWCYETGSGVAQDEREAVRWYRLAADQGHMQAQYNLGACYSGGIGVARNKTEAIKWFRLAAAQGDQDAALALRVCEA